MLRQIVTYIRAYPGVWFATGEKVAKAWVGLADSDTGERHFSPFITLVDDQ